MKILHIANFGLRKGGIGTVVEKLYLEQTLLGHDVKIATACDNLVYSNLKLIKISNLIGVNGLLNVWTPDAVMFHSLWLMPYLKIAKVLKKKGIPYGITMHGANSIENNKKSHWKKTIANLLWFNRFMKEASIIVFLNKKEYENCVSHNVNPNYTIMPNGCDAIDIDVESKKCSNPINIVYLGRIEFYHKGIDYLLDAIEILKKKGVKDFMIHFYGNETDEDTIQLKKRLFTLKSFAKYEGSVFGEKKTKVLSDADAFILTSRSEGMPMGVLEALSHGVPCILTSGTNMSSDVVSAGAGWQCELNAISIAETIEIAIQSLKVNYYKYHKAAHEMSKFYNWKEIAKQSIDILQYIANSKS